MVPWTFQNLNSFLKWVQILVTGMNSSILLDTTKIGFFLVLFESYIAFMCGGWWLSGGVLDWSSSITKGTTKSLYPLLRTGLIQDDPSRYDWKFCWIKNQNKQTNKQRIYEQEYRVGYSFCKQESQRACFVKMNIANLDYYPEIVKLFNHMTHFRECFNVMQ